MFKRMVVPLDGTRFAEAALAPARELARRFSAHILLMRAVSPSGLPLVVRLDRRGEPQADLDAVDDADGYLTGLTQDLRDAGYEASFLLFITEPGAGISRAAALDRADLIVMATHQRWTLNLTRSDSTTVEVLARSRVPILAWRPGATPYQAGGPGGSEALLAGPASPIVVPLDGSGFAESALPVAEELARSFKSSLVLVRAVGHESIHMGGIGSMLPGGAVALPEAQSDLDRIVEDLKGRGVHASAMVHEGTPPSVITAIQRERDAALVVMASHGSRGEAIGFLGSVAGAMVEESEVSVLVVRA